jgi:hypothetical protein
VKKPRKREGDLQAMILNVLRRLSFVRVDRYQSGMLPNPEGQMVSFGSTGAADIIVCVAPLGRLLGLECKAPGKKQTPAQIVWAQDIVSKGGFAYRVDDLDVACGHVLDVYGKNLRLHLAAGLLTEAEVLKQTKAAENAMNEAKRDAAEVQAKKEKRRSHMPMRRALPPGTNNAAGI